LGLLKGRVVLKQFGDKVDLPLGYFASGAEEIN
jgi:hypothetical protein